MAEILFSPQEEYVRLVMQNHALLEALARMHIAGLVNLEDVNTNFRREVGSISTLQLLSIANKAGLPMDHAVGVIGDYLDPAFNLFRVGGQNG